MTAAVIIATKNRAAALADTLSTLVIQTRLPMN